MDFPNSETSRTQAGRKESSPWANTLIGGEGVFNKVPLAKWVGVATELAQSKPKGLPRSISSSELSVPQKVFAS